MFLWREPFSNCCVQRPNLKPAASHDTCVERIDTCDQRESLLVLRERCDSFIRRRVACIDAILELRHDSRIERCDSCIKETRFLYRETRFVY